MALALPIVLGKLLSVFLASKPGKALAEKTGQAFMSSDEGIELAKKYAAASSAALGTAVVALGGHTDTAEQMLPNPRTMSTAAVIEDTAELLLAVGAVVKVIGAFMSDKEKLRVKTMGGYAPRVQSRFPADR